MDIFCGKDFRSYLDEKIANVKKEIESISEDELLHSSTQDLASTLVKKYDVTVPTLDLAEKIASKKEIDIKRKAFGYLDKYVTIKGTCFSIEIPFAGDSQLFYCQPSRYKLVFPQGEVLGGKVILSFERAPDEIKNGSLQLQKDIEEQIDLIQFFLESLREDCKNFSNSLLNLATKQIENRKQKLLNDNNILASLGFKLKETAEYSRIYAASNIRRKISIQNKTASETTITPSKPEPTLLPDDYENILQIIDSLSHVMERSPRAFSNMKEEDIRFQFLVQLNGHYEGQATGETFNYNGKTDILIRSNDENIFIGECKFWKGEKKYLETIDQILGYTVWRDTKTAILIFNRNNEMSKVLNTIKEVTPKHKCFRKRLISKQETEFRYIFSHLTDKEKELYLTVKVYDIPNVCHKVG